MDQSLTTPQPEAKQTTQSAPLEGLLTHLRTLKVKPHVVGRNVLDFGCGRTLKTLRALEGVAAQRSGVDSCFLGRPLEKMDGIQVAGSIESFASTPPFDRVIALACFEHLEKGEFVGVLKALSKITTQDAWICGTVPTPPSKPVLEFLSYKLKLIDESQIRDHKIYYDRAHLAETVAHGGWKLEKYSRFQLGLNSFFILAKN